MAKERISMGINLRQNKNDKSPAYGKYFPEVDVQKTLSLRGFAKHMTDHGSVYGRDLIEGVLIKITECLPELISQGIPVQLGNLGTFYPTAEVKKDAAVARIAEMEGLDPNDLVQAIECPMSSNASSGFIYFFVNIISDSYWNNGCEPASIGRFPCGRIVTHGLWCCEMSHRFLWHQTPS